MHGGRNNAPRAAKGAEMTRRRAIFIALMCLVLGAIFNVLQIAYSSLMGDGIDSGKIDWNNAMMHCAGEVRLNAVPESGWPRRSTPRSYEWITYIVSEQDAHGAPIENEYLVGQFTRGWPCPAAVGWMTFMPDRAVRFDALLDLETVTSPAFADGAVLPLKLMPIGFLVNIAFFAIMLCPWIWLSLWLVSQILTRNRRILRLWKHRCPFCGYPFGSSPVCTECGKDVSKWNPSCATKQMMQES
jgi:hypothetical protein